MLALLLTALSVFGISPQKPVPKRQLPIGAWIPDQTVHVGDEILRLWTIR